MLVTFRAAAFGRSTSYTLRYDFSEAPRILSWKLTKGDITSKLDGSYVFDPAEGSGTHVRVPPGGRAARADPGLHQDAGPEPHHVHGPAGAESAGRVVVVTSGAGTSAEADVSFGIDIGGTKVLGIALSPSDVIVAEARVPTPAAPAHPRSRRGGG